MKKVLIIILMFLSIFLYAGDLESIQQELQQNFDLWLNNDISSNQMFTKLSELEVSLENETVGWKSEYLKSRISLIKGQIYFEHGEKKSSIRELKKSLGFAEESKNLNEVSDTLRTMAEANSLLMLQKGFIYIIANFKRPQNQAKRALELDPDNSRAALVIAQFLCNAPAIAGGNLDEGIALLKSQADRDDLRREDKFALLQSLSEIYLDNDELRDALYYCNLALNLYPGNTRCHELILEIEAEKRKN